MSSNESAAMNTHGLGREASAMVFSATVLYMAVNSFSLASLEEYTKMTWHVADLGMVISRLTICCSTNELKDNTGGNTSLTGSWVVNVICKINLCFMVLINLDTKKIREKFLKKTWVL